MTEVVGSSPTRLKLRSACSFKKAEHPREDEPLRLARTGSKPTDGVYAVTFIEVILPMLTE